MIIDIEPNITNPIIIGSIAFVALFILMAVAWRLIINLISKLFEKSKFYFVAKVLKDYSSQVTTTIFLLSIYAAIVVVYEQFLTHPLSKIIGLLVLFSAINTTIKIILGIVDSYYMGETKKKKDKLAVHRFVQTLKTVIAVLLYAFAVVLIISIISYEMGIIISISVLGVAVLLFLAFLDQIKNIGTGIWMTTTGQIEEGDIIGIGGVIGTVENLESGNFRISQIDGKMVSIPATTLANRDISIGKANTDGMLSIMVKVRGKDSKGIKEKISLTSGKVALSMQELPDEFKPKVIFEGVEDGKLRYIVKLRIVPFSDLAKVIDTMSSEIYANITGIEDIKAI